MNKFFLKFWYVWTLALVLGFASCSDDDDDDDKVDYAAKIAGTYAGKISMGDQEIPEIYDIAVKRTSDNNVLMVLKDVVIPISAETSIPIDSVGCSSVVTFKDNKYLVDGKTTYEIEGIPVPVPVTIKGTFTEAGKIDLEISVENIMDINYSGDKKNK